MILTGTKTRNNFFSKKIEEPVSIVQFTVLAAEEAQHSQ